QGDCEVLRPGQWNNLGAVAGKVSSARPIAGGGGGPPVTSWGSGARAILYENHDLSGRSFVIDRDVMANLDRTDFNDRARSRRVLASAKTIAVVGLSAQWHRPSYFAAKYMQEHGYRIIPVNPNYAEILGEKSYASIDAIPERVDIVDCFRKPGEMPALAREAV